MTSDPVGNSASAARLRQFRAKSARQKIHAAEGALLWTIGIQVTFLPWAIGGTRHWAHWISLGLSVVAFVISLLPREYTDVPPGQAPFKLYTWPKLIRFPLFWIGLALLAYIIIQASNPAWVYQTDGKKWWMQKIPYAEWLPSGVSVPFERYGPWHMLVIYASVFFTCCALWIGFTRRLSLQTLFTVIAANAFLLAIIGIAQRATNADKIFWFWSPPASYFVSSFIYKNHAGAYFNLVLALCVGLALWHYERGLRRLDKSSPSGLFIFFATAIVLLIVFSYSRTATLLMFAFLLVATAIFFWRSRSQPGAGSRGKLVGIMIILALGSFVYLGMRSLKTERFMASIARLQKQVEDTGLGTRERLATATWEMGQDRPLYGWGSGSFRFCFPTYQRKYPEIAMDSPENPIYWEHAHNDYAEVFAEFGLVGLGLIVAGVGCVGFRYIWVQAWQNPVGLLGMVGCLLVAIHSFVDFQAYNPAILLTALVTLAGIIRWTEIEEVNT